MCMYMYMYIVSVRFRRVIAFNQTHTNTQPITNTVYYKSDLVSAVARDAARR